MGRVSAVDLMAQVLILMVFNLLYGKIADHWGAHYVGIMGGLLLILLPPLYETYLRSTSFKPLFEKKVVVYED